jgi:hypothetical protein
LSAELAFLGSKSSLSDWQTLADRGLFIKFWPIAALVSGMQVRFAPEGVTVQSQEHIDSEGRIWYNPGTFERLESDSIDQDSEFQFVARQQLAALRFLEAWISSRCIDSPALQRRWSNKPLQLGQIADRLPDYLAETILTCDPSSLTAEMVVKHVGENRWISEGTAFYTQCATPALLKSLAIRPMAPVLGQRRLYADYEYRTFRFGDEGVTVRFPMSGGSEVIDLQFHPESVKLAELVDSVVEDSFWAELTRVFDLNIYAVDFVLVDGRPLILELNPAFSWAWLPPRCLDAIAGSVERFLDQPSVQQM